MEAEVAEGNSAEPKVACKKPPPPPSFNINISRLHIYIKTLRGSTSGGIIAAIVIGAIVGVIAIIALVWYLRKRRLQKRSSSETAASKEALIAPMEISSPMNSKVLHA